MAAQASIPIFTNLNELYQNLGTSLNHASVSPHSERWNNLTEEYVKRFGRKPTYIARAPGRVNLIGEHIDYALFGAFPAAIEQDILIACGPRDTSSVPGGVVADNLLAKYARQEFAPSIVPKDLGVPDEHVHVEGWHLDIDTKKLRWESYVKAGYYGVLNRYFTSKGALPVPVDLLFTGTVPAGSGLSSSAAMVVASTLAFLAVNGKLDDSSALTKGELVEMAMQNEKRVGVNSGGLDQAASVICTTSSALYVTFFPHLFAQLIPLPPGAVFVCANTLVVSDKVVHARTRYNLRVVETLVAARVLARRLGVKLQEEAGGKRERVTLRVVLGRWVGETEETELGAEQLKAALEKMVEKMELLKPDNADGEEGVTLETMIEWSGLSKEEFTETYLSWVDVEATYFQLYKRAKHVFQEAALVLKFREVCLHAASAPDVDGREELGALMNASHASCRDLCDCSCPELNELTQLALDAGAYGSRLTGAAWGGCTVSLVAEDKVDEFIKKVQQGYAPFRELEGDSLKEVIFATKPSSGACVYKFED
ncbi:hypothetical protein PLICRDRAFT_337456 [Plicaturopsis crispa FD-325 SS-3]|uniref:Galactokinase n=1 Tax=Plicaturopsis crispa FD-325 SS-3 TaxID=944288 RepID=A0A0C9SS39_PLICR|nr:hypothetical protein PLICRDRAFT_337456 [Plicaturopsis crispa FD-325 SS-3]